MSFKRSCFALLLIAAMIVSGCSNENEPSSSSNQGKTETPDSKKSVDEKLNEVEKMIDSLEDESQDFTE